MDSTRRNVLAALHAGIALTAPGLQLVSTIRVCATMRGHGPCVFDEGGLGRLGCASAGAEGAEPLAESWDDSISGKQTAEGREATAEEGDAHLNAGPKHALVQVDLYQISR